MNGLIYVKFWKEKKLNMQSMLLKHVFDGPNVQIKLDTNLSKNEVIIKYK